MGGRGRAAARAGEGGAALAGEEERAHAGGRREGARRGRRGGRGREREEGRGGEVTSGSNSGDHHLQNLGHHGEREVEEGEGGCCTGNLNERGRGGWGAWGGVGRRGRAGRAGLGWAGLGRATSWIKTHDTHDYQTDSNREPKTEMERDEHAISDKEMCFGMMQHPSHLGFCSYTTRTLVTILV
jgi:hypothetical protein